MRIATAPGSEFFADVNGAEGDEVKFLNQDQPVVSTISAVPGGIGGGGGGLGGGGGGLHNVGGHGVNLN
jgi:hypothetical protein